MGSEIIATAKLQNLGSKPIQIPWSTDFRTTMEGQDPNNRSWEFGEFRMSLRDKQNSDYYDRFVTTSQPLYASKSVPGSYLTLKPGEWITARISFKIGVQNPKFEEVSVGTAALAMEWFQTVRTRVVKNCGVTLGYFPYDDPFHVSQSESSRRSSNRTSMCDHGTRSIDVVLLPVQRGIGLNDDVLVSVLLKLINQY